MTAKEEKHAAEEAAADGKTVKEEKKEPDQKKS
jgi:hypothetical protein